MGDSFACCQEASRLMKQATAGHLARQGLRFALKVEKCTEQAGQTALPGELQPAPPQTRHKTHGHLLLADSHTVPTD